MGVQQKTIMLDGVFQETSHAEEKPLSLDQQKFSGNALHSDDHHQTDHPSRQRK